LYSYTAHRPFIDCKPNCRRNAPSIAVRPRRLMGEVAIRCA